LRGESRKKKNDSLETRQKFKEWMTQQALGERNYKRGWSEGYLQGGYSATLRKAREKEVSESIFRSARMEGRIS